jgi:hypothetical protein
LIHGSTFLDREFTQPYIVAARKIGDIRSGLTYRDGDGYYDGDGKLYAKEIIYYHTYKDEENDKEIT